MSTELMESPPPGTENRQEEIELTPFEQHMGGPPPKTLTVSRKIRDGSGEPRLFVAGTGPRPSDLMLIASAAQEQEASEFQDIGRGQRMKIRPGYLQGQSGGILLDRMREAGFPDKTYYYTAMCKWLLPREQRMKPPKDAIRYGMPTLREEIREVKPKLILAFGKPVFDQLVKQTLPAYPTLLYGFFHSEEFNCTVMALDDVFMPVLKPEYVDRLRMGLEIAHQYIQEKSGVTVDRIPLNYRTVTTIAETRELVTFWELNKLKVFSVDCEWGGNNHIDGKLRSFQVCWAAGQAVYFKFRDEKGDYVFDASYQEVGAVLASYLNRPEVRYIGHHISADFPWMHTWLGLEWYQKCIFDSEFGQQVADEYVPLGLEELALRYTDLGRYDMDLEIWKKLNRQPDNAGYAFIPDDILIPYALKDVDVVMRAYPVILRKLFAENLWPYLTEFFFPFVTDVFTNFALVGMPVNMEKLDRLRELFQWAKVEMEKDFQELVVQEAKELLTGLMAAHLHEKGLAWDPNGFLQFLTVMENFRFDIRITEAERIMDSDSPEIRQAKTLALTERRKTLVSLPAFSDFCAQILGLPSSELPERIQAAIQHLYESPGFNIRSHPMLRRWLYAVKSYTPIKSTANKEAGQPSMSWDKILTYDKKTQEKYKPAVDKQSLQILADSHRDSVIGKLLDLNAVGNLCKAFLKPADVDDDGELVKENGLHYWVCTDGRIHGQMSTTETGRPRSWKPNCLNWPSYVNKRISTSVAELLKRRHAENLLPNFLHPFLTEPIPSIRSVVDVRGLEPLPGSAGWCLVESDYKTAEIRGLGFISGDPNLIRLVTEPDECFGLVLHEGKEKAVRLSYAPDSGISPENQDPKFIFAVAADNKVIASFTEADLLRDESGKLRHPPHDLHWSLAEMWRMVPRETLNDKRDRGAAKVGNFCIAENELVLTRKGWKPIQHVLDCDLLWDGVEWVHHDGVVFTGEKEIIEYQGLRATGLHDVWTEESGKIKFEAASTQCLKLERSETTCPAYRDYGFADLSSYSEEERQRLLLRFNALQLLRSGTREGAEEHGEGIVIEMPMSGEESSNLPISWSSKICNSIAGGALPGDGTTLRKGYARVFSALQNAWDSCGICFANGIRLLGFGELAYGILSQKGFRQDRQFRELFEDQFKAGGSYNQPTESRLYTRDTHRACAGIFDRASSGEIHRADRARITPVRNDSGSNSGPTRWQQQGGLEKTRTYDILNAGPRNRFTCQGVLVSNSSAYGATASTIERKIESDTGVKPAEGTGQKILDALAKRQPVADKFLKDMEFIPENPGYWRSQSGRLRRFKIHRHGEVNWRLYKSQVSALSREMRNFPFQNSVGDTASRAGSKLLDYYIRNGMHARPLVILYDAVVTICPLEERFLVADLHQRFMTDENCWSNHGVAWNYPIDTAFVLAWSEDNTKESPTLAAELKRLADPAYAASYDVVS